MDAIIEMIKKEKQMPIPNEVFIKKLEALLLTGSITIEASDSIVCISTDDKK